jgi:NAD+ synthetase
MTTNKLHPELQDMLAALRAQRGFNAQAYVDAKVRLLNDYCTRCGLTTLVWGNSGGVDSALVTALIAQAMKQPGSPIKRAVALLLPYFIKAGTTNQPVATSRGQEVAEHFGIECRLVDLSAPHEAMQGVLEKAFDIESGAWAAGQLVSYMRTPALYQAATLLRQEGYPGIVVGTCNRDEGGYIGYFGKAADYLTDLHLISDAHKSEVRAAAELLGVPPSVLAAAPTGDIYDGRTDRQLIGAPYDFIELYQLLLCVDEETRKQLFTKLGAEAFNEFHQFSSRLQRLNRENQHKYIIGSPSVHLDVYERAVPGGWRVEQRSPPAAVDASKFVNAFDFAPPVVARLRASSANVRRVELGDFGDSAFLAHGVLSAKECAAVNVALDKEQWVAADQNGKANGFAAARKENGVGSWRLSTYNDRLAKMLWERLAPCLPILRFADKSGPTTDFGDSNSVWRAVGVSSLMRFIKYTSGGLLVPHYDAPFDYRDGRRTLMSLVLYLTNNPVKNGGSTRFIIDPQRGVPLARRNLNDWDRLATPKDVLLRVKPKAGSALVFDHRLLHDSVALTGGVKVIMRTDIIFEKCGLPPQAALHVSKPLGMPD